VQALHPPKKALRYEPGSVAQPKQDVDCAKGEDVKLDKPLVSPATAKDHAPVSPQKPMPTASSSNKEMCESKPEKDRRLMPPPPFLPQKARKLNAPGSQPAVNSAEMDHGAAQSQPPTSGLQGKPATSVHATLPGPAGNCKGQVASEAGLASSTTQAALQVKDDEVDDLTLPSVVRNLLKGRAGEGSFDSAAWGMSIEIFYGTPLLALLDFELAKINRCVADQAASLGLKNDRLPVVQWNGVTL